MFGDLRSVIEILPEAVSSATAPKPNALLDNGKPTKLLDMALVAELMVRRYIQQANAAVVC